MSSRVVQLRVTRLRPIPCILLCGLLFPSRSDISESVRVDEDCAALCSWISAEEQAHAQVHAFKASVTFLKKMVYDSGPQPDKVSLPVALQWLCSGCSCCHSSAGIHAFACVGGAAQHSLSRPLREDSVRYCEIMSAVCDVVRMVCSALHWEACSGR